MAVETKTMEERWDEEGPLGIVGGRVVEASEDYDEEAPGVPVGDAAPRTLYVRRDLLNADEVIAHYARQLSREAASLLMDAGKLHVTVAYSRQPVDWLKVGTDYGFGSGGDEDGNLRVPPGGARLHERLGKDGARDALVLQFTSSALTWRWREFREGGASWDFEDYQPHVTLAWDKDQALDEKVLEPWRGELRFSPEIFEEIDEDWKAKAGIDE